MCRLLLVKKDNAFLIKEHLDIFANLCKMSKEFQGHGWGMTYLKDNKWETFKHIDPIWDYDFKEFEETRFLMVHARSAFQDKDIAIENNMPFSDERFSFIFNGELQGVKIRENGRIGAEKIFNYIKRFYKEENGTGNMPEAFKKGIDIIRKRTTYIRAMNIIMTDKATGTIYVSSTFNREPDYFTMQQKELNDGLIICSEKYPSESGWTEIPNHSIVIK